MKSSTQFVKGTLILAFANLLCRFLGFFYKIFLAQALGAEGMGIYQLIFPRFFCLPCADGFRNRNGHFPF